MHSLGVFLIQVISLLNTDCSFPGVQEYRIYSTEEFDKDFSKLDSDLQRRIDKEIQQLRVNPFVGKPLGYRFFREKKVKKYRIYFLIYDELVVVFVIAISDKKTQQDAINTIKSLIPHYRDLIKKKLSL